MALDTSNFIIDPVPVTESQGVIRYGESMDKRKAIAYRDQKDKESEQWKKLGLIQDLTDLSKHQTGSDIANAVGNQHANEVFKKYTAGASKMSPAELQYNISKDMSSITNGMDAMKNELTQSDEQLKQLKTEFPDLDIASMSKAQRADILNRRLKNANEFTSPMEVPPSQLNFSDPETLANYVTGDKNLRNYFQNPQGMDEMSVFKGSPNQYTKYTAKIPSWKKTSFDPAGLKGGFLPNQSEPQLQFKSSSLPSEALPSSNGKPFEMMDKDVYESIPGKEKIELIASAKKKFGDKYNSFNPTEKEYAQRNVLLDKAKAFDQTNFHPTEVHSPSASLLKFYAGGSGSGSTKPDAEIRDIYKEVSGKAGTNGTNMNEFSAGAQKTMLEYANKLTGEGLTQGDVKVQKATDGTINIVKTEDGKVIAPIDFGDLNVPTQPGVKQKTAVVNQLNKEYEYQGKKFTHSQIEKAAAQSNMSIDDYIKKVGLK